MPGFLGTETMITIEKLEALDDNLLIILLEGKSVEIQYRDSSLKNGIVTNSIGGTSKCPQ